MLRPSLLKFKRNIKNQKEALNKSLLLFQYGIPLPFGTISEIQKYIESADIYTSHTIDSLNLKTGEAGIISYELAKIDPNLSI